MLRAGDDDRVVRNGQIKDAGELCVYHERRLEHGSVFYIKNHCIVMSFHGPWSIEKSAAPSISSKLVNMALLANATVLHPRLCPERAS